MINQDKIIKIIIGINIFFFILSLVISVKARPISINPLRFFSPDEKVLVLLGAGGRIPVEDFGYWWSFVSAGYLHSGILHIFFNMAAFFQLFKIVADFYGISRTLIIYILGGISGLFLSYLSGVSLTIGASASVCGLIGACLYYGKSRGGNFGKMIFKQVIGWIVILLAFGLIIPGIDNFGHLGGIAGGFAAGFIFKYHEKRPESQVDRFSALFFIVLTLIILVFCAYNGLMLLFL